MATGTFDPTPYLLRALAQSGQLDAPEISAGVSAGGSPFGFIQKPDGAAGLFHNPMMGSTYSNPAMMMGGIGNTPQYWQHWNLPRPQPAQPRLPAVASAPVAPSQPPTPPQRPADIPAPNAAQAGPTGQEMQPGAYGQINGFNPLAMIGDPQAYANQFAGGNLNNIAARTYRNDDGSMWNDYYLINPGA